MIKRLYRIGIVVAVLGSLLCLPMVVLDTVAGASGSGACAITLLSPVGSGSSADVSCTGMPAYPDNDGDYMPFYIDGAEYTIAFGNGGISFDYSTEVISGNAVYGGDVTTDNGLIWHDGDIIGASTVVDYSAPTTTTTGVSPVVLIGGLLPPAADGIAGSAGGIILLLVAAMAGLLALFWVIRFVFGQLWHHRKWFREQ